ncbi:MAG: acyl-CoA thioesterase [Solirubrobacteraceae bacterium]
MGSPAPASVSVEARIQWVDTDASGNYHFTTAFRLFEMAEAELFSRLDLLSETIDRLPRVHASADFKRPLRFRDRVMVRVTVDAVGRASLTLRFEISRDRELCVDGRFVTVLLTGAGGETAVWSAHQRDRLLHGGPQAG